MNFLKLTESKLCLNEVSELVVHESCSGVSFFVETTSDFAGDRKVVAIKYEASDSMELQTLTKICDKMRNNWTDIKHIAIYHRLGSVAVKDVSCIIGVSSRHCQTSIDAVQYAIEELKTIPIRKRVQHCNPAMKRKLPKLIFADCRVDDSPVPKYLVQIGVDENEVCRRVNCFVDRKREEIDINNIKDFIDDDLNNTESEFSCARVNSSVYRRGLGSHLKVHRVTNEYGPQTKIDGYIGRLDKLMFTSPKKQATSKVSLKNEERLENAERFVNLKPEGTRTIHERIKRIEDRILHLETVSPEYNHFLQNNVAAATPKVEKKSYTTSELDSYIQMLQQNIKRKKLDN